MNEQKACIWSTYHPSMSNRNDDLLIVKERIIDKNGVESANVRMIRNYKRKYYVTKPGARDHTQKRDWENLENLDIFECTQAEMGLHSAKNTDKFVPGGFVRQREVNRSPYLYGTDVTTPVIVKSEYSKKYPDFNPRATVAVADFETDMLDDPEAKRIISGAYTYRGKIFMAVTEEFLGTQPDKEAAIKNHFQKYIDKFTADVESQVKRDKNGKIDKGVKKALEAFKVACLGKIDLKVKIVANDFEVAKAIMMAAHRTSPDYLTFWNMDFDVTAMLLACERNGRHPEEIFCDPNVDKEFRKFYYNKDQQIKKKANGETMSKDFVDLWHTIECPMSFYMVDAMSFYRLNRVMAGKLNTYALDAILTRELGIGKLKFQEASDVSGPEWHRQMQSNHKLSYLLYNIFDCLLVEFLDFKTKDLSLALGIYVGDSEISTANSNPKRLADACHFFLEKDGRIITSTSDQMVCGYDLNVLGTRDWIITLPAELVQNTGRSIVKGIPDELSRMSAHCGDIDLASSYPTTGSICNISPDATRMEIYKVKGLEEVQLRKSSVDYTGCDTNAVQLSRTLYGVPKLNDALAMF